MNTQDLAPKLCPTGGVLTISQGTLTANLIDLFAYSYDGQPIVITNATSAPAGSAITVTGRSTFLGVPDLPLTARFDIDEHGDVRALLRYRMRDAAPGPNAWTFSRSFPKLPAVIDWNTELPADRTRPFDRMAGQVPLLDALDLFDTFIIVSTHAGTDPETGLLLSVGINLVSQLRPAGLVGVLEHVLGDTPTLTLHGTIRAPRPTEKTPPLDILVQPWEHPEAPGIHLQAALNAEFKLGGVVFKQAAFRIYSPLTTAWQGLNPTFAARHGLSGTLAIPSAGIEVQLGANLKWNLPRALLYGRFQGVSLRKLTNLLDLTGSDGLSAQLPEEVHKGVDALETLALEQLTLDIGLLGLMPVVQSVTARIGFQGLTWKVWEDHLIVQDLWCQFAIVDPFHVTAAASAADAVSARSNLKVTLAGTLDVEGAPLQVRASNQDGFVVRAMMTKKQNLPLEKLLKAHAPDVPAPTPLAVDYLDVTVALKKSYSMMAVLAAAPDPWIIPVGRESLTVRDVTLTLDRPVGGKTTGTFSGQVAFVDDLILQLHFAVPGSFTVRSVVPRLNLSKLIDRLCNEKLELPGGFDLVLENAAILIQKQNDDYTFRIGTSLKDFGLFAFEARKLAGGKWGFAAGVDLAGAGLSKLPGFGGLKSIEDSFKLEKLMLVLSSFADAGFSFPDLAEFNQPQLATGKLRLPAQGAGVVKGLMLYAQWQLGDGRELKLLRNLLGLGGTQSATIAIGANPAKDFRLSVSEQTTIQKLPFQFRFGVELANGNPSWFLTGALTARLQGHLQTFDVTTAFVPGGAFLSATMQGTTAVDFGPFKLSNLALQIGADWAGIPSLGIAANIDLKSFTSSVAMFFDSTDPARCLVAGSISSLTAKDVLSAFVPGVNTPLDGLLQTIAVKGTHEFAIPGDLTDELDGLMLDKIAAAFAVAKMTIPSSSQQLTIVPKRKGAAWHLTDMTTMRHYQLEKKGDKIQVQIAPQFYFAAAPTFIGTIKFPQAFYLNAALSFAGFDATATIDISPNRGFAVDAQLDKIVLLKEELFALASADGKSGPQLSVSTFSQPDHKVAEFRLPHFYINGSLTLLGARSSVYASVTTKGVDIELKGKLVPGVDFDVTARFGKAGLAASGQLKVGVGTIDLGPLGKAKINTELQVAVDVDIVAQSAKTASAAAGMTWKAGDTLLANEIGVLIFQSDGNLIFYDTTGESWAPLWATGTSGATRLAFQSDGNLVVYNGAGKLLWASNTAGSGATQLTVQPDGNVVLYDRANHSKWATGTQLAGGQAGASLELDIDLIFLGEHIDIPSFRIEAQSDTFTQLPKLVEKKIAEALNGLYKDAAKWAKAVGAGVLDGVQDTEKVLKDVYKKSDQEAKTLVQTANKDLNKGVKAIDSAAKSTGKAVTKTLKKAKFW